MAAADPHADGIVRLRGFFDEFDRAIEAERARALRAALGMLGFVCLSIIAALLAIGASL